MRPGHVAFVSTVHDPDGRLIDATVRLSARLAAYPAVYLRCTPTTDRWLMRQLDRAGDVSVGKADRVGDSRREAVERARAGGAGAIFYCDFDRWLHWAGSFPEELDTVPEVMNQEQAGAWYVCLGRTRRAFATHPPAQRETESGSNAALSQLIGMGLDATAGACWMTDCGADLILARSTEATNATDLEWPALIARHDSAKLGTHLVEGLEFETATFYQAEIRAAGGVEAWIAQQYSGEAVWAARRELMEASIRAARRVYREI